MNAATRELALRVDAARRERIPKREARLVLVPPAKTEPAKPKRSHGKTRKLMELSPRLAVREAQKHPSFSRVVASICPFSGLSRDELEQHVAGVLAMVDAADNRKEGLV